MSSRYGTMSTDRPERWAALRERIADDGLRNSLLLAIAPTATIASIAGVYECIEPQVSNLFKRETLSGEFLQVNSYLVNELKELGVWDARTREALREAGGSVQDFAWIPEDVRRLYRTAWEIPQRGLIDRTEDAADRRMKRLRLTDKGRDLVLKMRELRMAGFEQFVATLNPKERTALAKALEPILARDDVVAFCGGRK